MIQAFVQFAFLIVAFCAVESISKRAMREVLKEQGLAKEEEYKEPFRFRPFGRFSEWWRKNHYWP